MSGPLQFKVFEAPQVPDGVKLCSPEDVVKFLGFWERAGREVFQVIYLTAKNAVLHVEAHSAGGPDTCGVHPSEIFKLALALNASAIILFHNHPSGVPDPSSADKKSTVSLVILGAMLGFKVLDHIIMGRAGRYFSFQEAGFIDEALADGEALLGRLAVSDVVPAGCPDCGWWAGDLEFSRFHCWRRTKATAPESGEGCSQFWPAGVPLPGPAAPTAAAEVVDPGSAEVVALPAVRQLSLFGGDS